MTAPIPHFVEAFVDSGYMDMWKIMRALREVEFDGVVIGDHFPQMVGGPRASVAYTVGYMKALLARANARANAGLTQGLTRSFREGRVS